MFRLVRPLDGDADVLCLFFRELGELCAELGEVQSRDLLVEVLWQHRDALAVGLGVLVELDLKEALITKLG